MSTDHPAGQSLLSEQETTALVALVRKATGLELELPPDYARNNPRMWQSFFHSTFQKDFARQMAAYREKHKPY